MFARPSSNAYVRPLTQDLTTYLIPSILPLLAGALLTGLALGPAQQARAQAAEPTAPEMTAPETAAEASSTALANALGLTSPAWRAHFGEQAARTLRERSPKAQTEMLRDLIAVAKMGRNGIDLSAALPPLMDLFEESTSEPRRLMALHALSAIGTDHASEFAYRGAIKRLSREMRTEPPGRIRRVAARIVDDFYQENGVPLR